MHSKYSGEFAHMQNNVNPYILRMLEGIFSLAVAHVMLLYMYNVAGILANLIAFSQVFIQLYQ